MAKALVLELLEGLNTSDGQEVGSKTELGVGNQEERITSFRIGVSLEEVG